MSSPDQPPRKGGDKTAPKGTGHDDGDVVGAQPEPAVPQGTNVSETCPKDDAELAPRGSGDATPARPEASGAQEPVKPYPGASSPSTSSMSSLWKQMPSCSSDAVAASSQELQRLRDEDHFRGYRCEEEEEILQAEARYKEFLCQEEADQIREFLASLPKGPQAPLSSDFSLDQMPPDGRSFYNDPQMGDVATTSPPPRTMAEGEDYDDLTPSPSRGSPVREESTSTREDSTEMSTTRDESPTRRGQRTAEFPASLSDPGPSTGARSRETLKELMARRKRELKEKPEPQQEHSLLDDPYLGALNCKYVVRGKTGVVYDKEMLNHKCEWDPKHPECPERAYVCMEQCFERGLLAMCETLPNYLRSDVSSRILDVHSKDHYERLQNICQLPSDADRELAASGYDSVFFNQSTFDAATRAVSSTLNLVLTVAKHEVMNGMAFVRPPGHHAMSNEFNGYCFFNNVAIAAEACLKDGLTKRILIVDIDVHHGQGTQRMFYDRKDVLYFSIHRYEHGCFWPNLKESNFNYIGKGEGLGYNINVPLNATGLSDGDYMAIVMQILLPVGYEFNPDLVIVSAGYDAVVGCPEGRMNVTPGFYSHLIQHLHSLCCGHIAVVLEGGYFLPTLAESACATLKTLLGGPCPILEPVRAIDPTVVETITSVKRSLYGKWKCFDVCEFITEPHVPGSDRNAYKICYFGVPDQPPYLTRNCYSENSTKDNAYFEQLNRALQEKYRSPVSLPTKLVFHEDMLLHSPQRGDVKRPERPSRLGAILNMFKEYGLHRRLMRVPVALRDWTKYSPHVPRYFDHINRFLPQHKDLYVNEFTHDCVDTAINCILSLADDIMSGRCGAGIALVRPPGHHAEHDRAMGFCFVNNVGVLAKYLQDKYQLQRILIVDFDVHHGNGTQNMFYTSPHVMYISIHKDNHGKFFPANSQKTHRFDGHGPGKGYNINVPFNNDAMGDTEYMAAFHNVVLPAAYAFAPEIVIVSAGFDAGVNDLLGGYNVTPEMFGHMILMLKPLAEGKMILALEGGYNKVTTSYGMAICAKALLGDPVVMPKNLFKTFSPHAIQSIREVTRHFRPHFGIFHCSRRLAQVPVIVKQMSRFTSDMYGRQLYRALDPDKVDDNTYVEDEMRGLNRFSH